MRHYERSAPVVGLDSTSGHLPNGYINVHVDAEAETVVLQRWGDGAVPLGHMPLRPDEAAKLAAVLVAELAKNRWASLDDIHDLAAAFAGGEDAAQELFG